MSVHRGVDPAFAFKRSMELINDPDMQEEALALLEYSADAGNLDAELEYGTILCE